MPIDMMNSHTVSGDRVDSLMLCVTALSMLRSNIYIVLEENKKTRKTHSDSV